MATATVYSEVSTVTSGATQAQFYCGQETLVWIVFWMKIDKQFVSTLEDTIRQSGAMDTLWNNIAQVEITGQIKYILRAYIIGN